jgi:hypothetical protein
MKPEQAAARLGTVPYLVADVADHPSGHVVTLADGTRWLVTDTVARRYVPEIDLGITLRGKQTSKEEVRLVLEEGEGAVPAGSAAEVLEWVGEDRERAAAALAAEQARSSPRKTVLARLDELAEEA